MWGSGCDEFANNVASGEKASEPSATHDGDTLDVLVRNERRDIGDGLFRRDAEHLPRHDVPNGAAAVRARWSEPRAGSECRRHEMSHELALAEKTEQTTVGIDDRQRAEARREHLARCVSERHLR